MENILYISVAVIAVAFLVLVLYIIQTLKSLQKSLNSVTKTVEHLQNQVQVIVKETEHLLKTSNELAEDWKQKSEKLNSVVSAAGELGHTVKQFNTSLKSFSKKVIKRVEEKEEFFSQVAGWGKIAIELKEKWDEVRRRREHQDSVNR